MLSQPISLNGYNIYDEDISIVHGHPKLYKPFLSGLSVEQVRICDNIFYWKKGSEIAYRNAKFASTRKAWHLLTLTTG